MQAWIKKFVQDQQLPTVCYICDANLAIPHNATSHYASRRHKENVKIFQEELKKKFQDKVVVKEAEPVKTSQCNVCNVSFAENAADQHYKSDDHRKKKEAYCDVCLILTMSKEQLWQHMHGSKHMQKLKDLELPAIDVQYSPFDQTLPQVLKNMMFPDACQVCSLPLATMKKALSHYRSQIHQNSVRHWFKERRQIEKIGGSGKLINEVVNTNKIQSQNAEPIIQKNHKDLPKILVDYNCFVCGVNVNVEAETDNHKVNFPHTELAKLKSNMVAAGRTEEYWVRQGKRIYCSVCNVYISTPSDASEHFNSRNHCFYFHTWYRKLDVTKIPSEEDTKWFYCKICDKQLDGTSDAERHYVAISHQKRSELYCKICDARNLTSEMLEVHYTTTLHKENLTRSNNEFWEGYTHNTPPSQSDINDTTNKNQQKNSDFETGNSGEHPLDTDRPNAQSTSENIPPASLEDFRADSNDNQNRAANNLSASNPGNEASLREQVFQEVDKLVKTLYYSKTVPYDVALEYLKQINKEVEGLKEKYGKKECQNSPEHLTHTYEVNDKQYYFETENFKEMENLNRKNVSKEDEFYSFKNDSYCNFPVLLKNSPKEIQHIADLIDFSDDSHTSNSNDNKDLFITDKKTLNDDYDDEDVEEAESQVGNRNETPHLMDEQDSLEIMLEKIILIRNEVDKDCPDEDNIERDVLSEIERLIMVVKNEDIPLDVTLTCLQNFNKELDPEVYFSKQDSRNHEGKIEADDAVKDEQDMKYRYSKEDLLSLRTKMTFEIDVELKTVIFQRGIWRRNYKDLDLTPPEDSEKDVRYRYSKEDLLSLRTDKTFKERLGIQLGIILNQTGIWNRNCNDLSFIEAEFCISNSCYSYYTDNIVGFLDFFSKYTQGSIENNNNNYQT